MVPDLGKFIFTWGGNIIIHNLYSTNSVIVIQRATETQWNKGEYLQAEEPPTSIFQGLAGPGMGKCLPKGRVAFSLYKSAVCLPRSLRGGAHSKSQIGEVLTRGSPLGLAIWNGALGEHWVVLVFMIRTRSLGLYFVGNLGVIEGFCLATRTKTLIKESYKRNIGYLYKLEHLGKQQVLIILHI